MRDQFIPYELALKLKDLNFDEPCIAYWQGENSPSPTIMSHQGTIYVDDFNYHRNTFLSLADEILVIPNEEDFKKDLLENPYKYKREKWGLKVIAPLWQQAFDWCLKQLSEYSIKIYYNKTGEVERHDLPYLALFDDYKGCLEVLIDLIENKK